MDIRTRDLSDERIVHFFADEPELVLSVTGYLADGIRAGCAVVALATEVRREALAVGLGELGVDVTRARALGLLQEADAAGALASFRGGDGQIDREAFDREVGGLVRAAAATGRGVRAYGELVALLWDAGDVGRAIEVELLWNELRASLPLALYCAYPHACVPGGERSGARARICGLHSAVRAPQAAVPAPLERRAPPLVRTLPAHAGAPCRARRETALFLRGLGYGDALLGTAAIVVSELASNAVLHARCPFSLMLCAGRDGVVIAVEDARRLPGGSCRDVVARPRHGLGLVDALTTRWGVDATARGKVVWAELA